MKLSLPRKSKEMKVKMSFLRWWLSVNFLFTNPRGSVELIRACLQKYHDPKIVTDVYSWLTHRSSDATNRLFFCFGLLLFAFANLFLKHYTSSPELESQGCHLTDQDPSASLSSQILLRIVTLFLLGPSGVPGNHKEQNHRGDWLPTWQLRFDFIFKGYQICS